MSTNHPGPWSASPRSAARRLGWVALLLGAVGCDRDDDFKRHWDPTTLQFLSPSSDAVAAADTPITFLVEVGHDFQQLLADHTFDWDSSRSGTLYGETTLTEDPTDDELGTLAFTVDALEVGTHTITLTADAEHTDPATASVNLEIRANTDPDIDITAPEDGAWFETGSDVAIAADFSDETELEITTLSVSWDLIPEDEVDVSGALASAPAHPDEAAEATFTIAGLPDGTYTLFGLVVDSAGAVDDESVTFTISASDADGDGYVREDAGGDDCNDAAAAVNPGAEEDCEDGIDNNCDGILDDCGMAGDHTLAEADTTIYGDEAGDALGTQVATRDLDDDGAEDLVIGLRDAAGGGSMLVALGPLPGGAWTASDIVDWVGEAEVSSDHLGQAVATGQSDGGVALLAVGVSGWDGEAGLSTGAVQIGPWSAGAWAAASTVEGQERDESLGAVIALADLDGDGVDDLILGSPDADPDGANNAGKVYVLYADGGYAGTVADADITYQAAEAKDGLGAALGVGDLDHEGVPNDLILGAPGVDTEISGGGAVYVMFSAFRTEGAQDVAANASATYLGAEEDGGLGTSLATADLDDNGYGEVAAGAPGWGASVSLGSAGAAYLFADVGLDAGVMDASTAEHVVLGDAQDQEVGASVSLGRAVDADAGDWLIGAPGLDVPEGTTGAEGTAGAALLYHQPDATSAGVEDADARFFGLSDQDDAGRMVHLQSNLNADAHQDLLVGAPRFDHGGTSTGVLYVYYGRGL